MNAAAALGWIRSGLGEVCTQGAHVARWRPGGADLLFVSRAARFEPGQAIRGGIPVIFPWFGDDPEKRGRGSHGFARKLPWRVTAQTSSPTELRATLELCDDESTRSGWPHRFLLRLEAVLGDELSVALTTLNRGTEPFAFEAALHTYLQVGDVRAITLRGLEGARYLDKLDGFREKRAPNEPLTFDGPIDNVYLGTQSACELEDIVHGRTLVLEKDGSRSTVVWNPWMEGGARMADLGAEDWAHFLCVETANVGPDAVRLDPGAAHTMRVRLLVR